MKTSLRVTTAAFFLTAFNLSAATLLVSLESTNPVAPFATWETAATNIQDAVDAAKDGDTVLVTNGVYAVGGRFMTNHWEQWEQVGGVRVSITNSIRLASVNGPSVTVIEGKGTWITNDVGEVVSALEQIGCVHLGTNAVLSGFTMTNGFSGFLSGFFAGGVSSEPSGVVTNCTLTRNRGGASGCTLYNCKLTENIATISDSAGGAMGCTLYNCTLTGNVGQLGGAAAGSTLYNCRVVGNSGVDWDGDGGGVAGCILYNCIVSDNVAGERGGGAWGSSLYNCIITGNSARYGGGVSASSLFNCTVTGNSASDSGGGAAGSTLQDSIVYYNTAPNGANYFTGSGPDWNDVSTLLNYSCTSPLPTNGLGNIDADPRFVNAAAGDFRLRADSPCIDAGTDLSSIIQTDIEGQFRPQDGNKDGVAAFDIGAYEFRPSPMTLHVSLESTNPIPPFATWETAATNIQDAVDASHDGDTVLVTNGVYAVGERDGNRVSVTTAISLESVNGRDVTTIDGGGSVRCVYLGDNAVLNGFTLTGGQAGLSEGGGGVFCEPSGVVSNCTLNRNVAGYPHWAAGGGAYGGTLYDCEITGNVATTWHSAARGGGACACTLYNCTLTGNTAWGMGGGAYLSTLYNCTLIGNSDTGVYSPGGGAAGCTLYNCTLANNSPSGVSGSTLYNCTLIGNSGGSDGTFYNCTVVDNQGGVSGTAFNSIMYYNSGGNYGEGTLLNYCLTSPLPTNGLGNITGLPLFMDREAGDFRLREDSPCIDTGTNLVGAIVPVWNADVYDFVPIPYPYAPTDILGNTRFIDGNGDGIVAWDIGAYEFNSFKPPRFSTAPQLAPDDWKLNITGEPNKWVTLQRTANLKDWEEIWSGRLGSDGTQQCDDPDTGRKVMFYRVVVP